MNSPSSFAFRKDMSHGEILASGFGKVVPDIAARD